MSAHYARQMDGLSATMYRSIGLVITLLPLLFFGIAQEGGFPWEDVRHFSLEFLATGILGAIATGFSFWSMRLIPLGVGNVFRRSGSIILAFIIGYWWFGESSSLIELALVVFILLGAIGLSFQKKDFAHLDNNAARGIALSLLAALIGTLMFGFITKISRGMNPFIAGYIWESLIAVFATILVFGRQWLGGKTVARMSWSQFKKLALVCSPTLLGTGAALLALTKGDLGILTAIGAGGIFVTILLSHWLYHEKLSRTQLLWIVLIVAGIVGLKLVG